MGPATSDSACDLQSGEWQRMSAPVDKCEHDLLQFRRCSPEQQLMHWQPRACNLPEATSHSLAQALGKRKLRFIGDSTTYDHFLYVASCVMNCSSTLTLNMQRRLTLKDPRYRTLWYEELTKAGYNNVTAAHAIEYMRLNNGKEHVYEGCSTLHGGHVDVRSLNMLPGQGLGSDRDLMRAVLHGLVYIGYAADGSRINKIQRRKLDSSSMGPSDVVLLNFGLHVTANDSFHAQMVQVLDYWAGERTAGRAPQLLWRQGSPQHWPTPFGQFRSLDDVGRIKGCQQLPKEVAADALPSYDRGVSDLFRRPEYGAWADVLPLFVATWERVNDHPKLHNLAHIGLRGTALNRTDVYDCTHFCSTGSTTRFWTAALLRWLRLSNRG